MFETVVAVISALTALGSLWFTERQWRKISKKIAMLSDANAASEVLPAWYTQRMMSDEWAFGLHMSDGHVVAVSSIAALSDDGQWMDVDLLTQDELPDGVPRDKILTAVANDRRRASLQIKNIVAAYELATS